MPNNWSKKQRSANHRKRFTEFTRPEQAVAVEYYQPSFLWMNDNLPVDVADVSGIRRSFWGGVVNKTYTGREARELVQRYASYIEDAIKKELESRSLTYWLHVYRRISPLSIGDNKDPTTTFLVRQTLEAAFQKYGLLTMCEGIGWSDELTEEQVLTGVPIEAKDAHIIQSALRGPRKQILKSFGLPELGQVYRCEALAYEIWRCTSSLRWISKGSTLRVDSHHDRAFFDEASPALRRLVRHYDNRDHRMIASATGTVFATDKPPNFNQIIMMAQYNVLQDHLKWVKTLFKQFDISFIPMFRFNFEWLPFNLVAYFQAHTFFSDPFARKRGFSLESLLIALQILLLGETSKWGDDWTYMLRSFQRAYVLVESDASLKNWIESNAETQAKQFGCPTPTSHDLSRAIDFLTLTKDKQDAISLLTGGPKYIVLPVRGNEYAIDYAWIARDMHYLFLGIPLQDDNFKGKLLEEFVGRGESILPDKECRGLDGQSREVDAAFQYDDVLVIAECKANARSIAFDRGDEKAIAYRNGKLEDALTQVDDKAAWFAKHRTGHNFDLSNIKIVLPVVVTPFVEYIPSELGRYWIDEETPRAMTPDEFKALLLSPRLRERAISCTASVFFEKDFSTPL